MNKRNAAAAAANGTQEGEASSAGDAPSVTALSQPPNLGGDRLRNPFADDEDDDDPGSESGSGSDDGDVENLGGEGGGGSGWNRGSWWRGMVRGTRRGNPRLSGADKDDSLETEKFGDGRDDSDSDGPGDDVEDDIEDEEFGDFAMPEVEGRARDGPGSGGLVSGIDPAREKLLLKPLPVHPSAMKSTSSPFVSLWPFSTQPFGAKRDDSSPGSTDRTGESEKGAGGEKTDGGGDVVGEDGQKIDRAVEAKSRTSIEDPDEDDVDVGEEIMVGRSGAN